MTGLVYDRVAVVIWSKNSYKTKMSAPSLPIEQIKGPFIDALNRHQTIVLSAPPGAGKSTRLPLWLLENNQLCGQKIYLLQPRRLAAKTVACFLAKQLGETIGKTVGYRLKNESKVSKDTQLEVITEGIFTQIIQHDPELEGCALVIFDEFHERSLNADLAFALARDVQQGLREDLKLLLMSATLSTTSLLKQLPDAVSLASEGRSFSVDVDYIPAKNSRMWREHALSVCIKSMEDHQGSILVFVSGIADIRFLAERLAEYIPKHFLLCPLYGDLTLTQQQQAIAPTENGIHKIVLATNIAETSLTIEGINLVIDCGLEKVAIYDAQTLTNQLQLRNISKASAVQRMGRAGRVMAGKCLRLYSSEDFHRRNEQSISEIQQADLLPMVIELARWGVKKLADLPMIELPAKVQESQAWSELQQLQLLDEKRNLTKIGERVAGFSCHPRFAKMIVSAVDLEQKYKLAGLTNLAALLAALLEDRDIFRGERAFTDCDLRHRLTELIHQSKNKRYQTFFLQMKKHLQKTNKTLATNLFNLPIELTGVLLALAYPERIAKQRTQYGHFLSENGKGLVISEQDALAGEAYIVAANLSEYQQKLQVRLAAPVDIEQLVAWKLITLKQIKQLNYDTKTQRISAKQQTVYGAIVLTEKPSNEKISHDAIATLWLQQIQRYGLSYLNWRDDDHKLLGRWRWITQTQQHLNFPEVKESDLVQHLSLWLAPFIGDIKNKNQLDKVTLSTALLSLLDYKQQKTLDKIAPEYFVGPTGRRCPIRYSTEQAPIVSMPMQELYGVSVTPNVGDNQHRYGVALIIELLSPAKRPIQVTQDLVAFWQGSYKEVQKEMKAKYPKHFWPDDPANAQATNRVKKYM
jgi:ATP-dependent helicase HrpB